MKLNSKHELSCDPIFQRATETVPEWPDPPSCVLVMQYVHVYMSKKVSCGSLGYFLGFYYTCKCKLWHHLLVTIAVLAPRRTFHGQNGQYWLLLNSKVHVSHGSKKIHVTSASSHYVADKLLGFLCTCMSKLLICWYGTCDTAAYCILCNCVQHAFSFGFGDVLGL